MSVDFRFVDFNYPFQSSVAITSTSEDVNFPAINAGKEFRSKAWRSSGYYEITDSNNKIDFKELGVGPEITATIINGNYDATGLALAIKTAFEAVGAETYTISFAVGSGLWTVSTTGAFLSLLFSTGTNASSSVRNAIGFGLNDFTGGTVYGGAFISLHTFERVVFDIKTTEPIDTFAALWDPSEGNGLSQEAVIKLKGNHSANFDSPLVDITLSIDDTFNQATHFFTEDQNYRFWAIEIVDPKNPNLYVELGTIILGKTATFTRIPSNGFKYTEVDNSKLISNDYRNQYVDLFPTHRELDFDINILDYAQVQVLEDIYRRVGIQTPVFVALDVGETMFDKDNFAIFGRMEKKLNFRHVVTQYFRTKFKITESF